MIFTSFTAMLVLTCAVGNYVRAQIGVDNIAAGKFSFTGAISYAAFKSDVVTRDWLELYTYPVGTATQLSPLDEAKPKHEWTVDDGVDVTTSSDDTVTRNTVCNRNGACIPYTATSSVHEMGSRFVIYTGNIFGETHTADLFFSTDTTKFLWWLKCDDANGILETICDSGQIKLLVSDTRAANDNDVTTTFGEPPFKTWEKSLYDFSRLSFTPSLQFTLSWKAANECDLVTNSVMSSNGKRATKAVAKKAAKKAAKKTAKKAAMKAAKKAAKKASKKANRP